MKKTCSTCKHGKDHNGLSYECDRVKLSIEGDFVNDIGKRLSEQYPDEPYDFPELSCDGEVDRLLIHDGGHVHRDFEVCELFSSVRILFGANFGCPAWEAK